MARKDRHSVLVAGAGPAGLAAALFLRQRGVDVEVVDERWDAPDDDFHVILHPDVVERLDDAGARLDGNAISGNLCIARPWPGQARSIWGDHSRYRETYYARFPGLYFTGDGCTRDPDGYYWITGRVDDVLNVSGHRLGTAEIESALVAHESVAEAAVVGYPHDIKGTGVCAFVAVRGGRRDEDGGELYEPLDLGIGRCTMIVAERADAEPAQESVKQVRTHLDEVLTLLPKG